MQICEVFIIGPWQIHELFFNQRSALLVIGRKSTLYVGTVSPKLFNHQCLRNHAPSLMRKEIHITELYDVQNGQPWHWSRAAFIIRPFPIFLRVPTQRLHF